MHEQKVLWSAHNDLEDASKGHKPTAASHSQHDASKTDRQRRPPQITEDLLVDLHDVDLKLTVVDDDVVGLLVLKQVDQLCTRLQWLRTRFYTSRS